ncbi:unnamed protein product [Urochloa humidicola]
METESHRRRLMSTSEATGECSDARHCSRTSPSTGIHDLTEDLLELVLARIRSPICIHRAMATCKQWRRVIGGTGFVHRFRSIHAPCVLGQYYPGGRTIFVPLLPPPGAAAAMDICDGAL